MIRKVRYFKQALYWKWLFSTSTTKSTTQSRLHFKQRLFVRPITIHVLGEHEEFKKLAEAKNIYDVITIRHM